MYYMVGAATQRTRGEHVQEARTKRSRKESEVSAKKREEEGQRGPQATVKSQESQRQLGAPEEPSTMQGKKSSKQAS